ncbi:hypothetical protein GUJ93_ZPchr0008g12051 [Zizania palustris]|uniref:Pectinesterase inhibitor domain-containing protein n=1 Tax=Zizania palustris TaxID=103762 RepID=A0A8J5V480_ZIZPA|nr:hypothetical protein GUJ93_ZPchr0008g12051 [Zizania palustris]
MLDHREEETRETHAQLRIKSTMAKVIGSLAAILVLVAGLCLVAGAGDRCPGVPSMTAEKACKAVCGTAHMRSLCLRTLLPRAGGDDGHGRRDRRGPVTYYVGVAAHSALDAYAATAAAKRKMEYSGALPEDERTAHERCMAGYNLASRFMSRLANVLTTSCDDIDAAQLTQDYKGSLRGMDACRRKLFAFPASPLYYRNLADRNKTLLAALLCTLVSNPSET